MQKTLVAVLIAVNIAMVLVANVSFKFSAAAHGWRPFLTWQVVGNIAGFASVLTLTALLRQIPLHVAYPVTAGLGFVLVQVVGAHYVLHEAVSTMQWFGSALVLAGAVLLAQGGK